MAGIYIHIPFCKQACSYCNFHFSTSLAQKGLFLDALQKEISLTSPIHAGERIETIYIGGGTPSLLLPAEIEGIIGSVKENFNIAPAAEITLEANPDDVSPAILQAWQHSGINRLSLGVQSFFEEELRWMNRAHNATDSLQSIDAIMEAGFSNFSVDLIYGSPMLSDDALRSNLDRLFSRKVPHLSCYALTVEPRTALANLVAKHRSEPVDPERQSAQFLLLMELMEAEGYEHYEISNFARPGMRSRHNSSYWQGAPYYGFGPSAHSFNGTDKRRWNIANNSLYISSLQQGEIPFEEELLTSTQQLNEHIMISLRTIEGLDLQKVKQHFGEAAVNNILKQGSKYTSVGKLEQQGDRLVLTREGKLFADGIAADLFV